MIFFGTSSFSVHILNKLEALGIVPTHIISVPDKPQGRKMVLTPTPAKVWAMERNIPVLQFEKLREYSITDTNGVSHNIDPASVLRGVTKENDVYIVASYGKIIPQAILDIPTHGCLNVHPSLLPKYRGASPLQSTLLSNEQELGVCIIKMDKDMDHGPIAAVEYLTPGEGKLSQWPMRFSEYEKVTAEIGAELLSIILPSIYAGTHEYTIQDHDSATYTAKITKEDGHVTELSHLQPEVYKNQQDIPILHKIETYLRFCAMEEWPGLYFFMTKDDKDFRVKISDMVWNKEIDVAEITRVVPEGKKEMSWKDFINYSIQ